MQSDTKICPSSACCACIIDELQLTFEKLDWSYPTSTPVSAESLPDVTEIIAQIRGAVANQRAWTTTVPCKRLYSGTLKLMECGEQRLTPPCAREPSAMVRKPANGLTPTAVSSWPGKLRLTKSTHDIVTGWLIAPASERNIQIRGKG